MKTLPSNPMNIFERLEHWYNCRKIELSHWLKDSSMSYKAIYRPEKAAYDVIAVSAPAFPGTPEWENQRKLMAERRARHEKLCALDPAYKAQHERKKAERERKYQAHLETLNPEIREQLEHRNKRIRQQLLDE